MSAWIEKLVQPISDNKVGVDPRSSDEFYELKEEVNKVSGIDYALIKNKAEVILQQQGKDLRAASYLILARLNLDGFEGLCEALKLFSSLIEQYGNALYPQKIDSKLISIKWLNETRVKHMLKDKVNFQDQRQAKVLLRNIEDTNKQLSQKLTNDVKLFANIIPLLRAQQVNTVQPVHAQPAANDQSTTSGPKIEQCQSEAELRELTRLQCQYLRQQQQWLRAMAFSRAYRWGALQEIRADNNVTSVPAIEDSVLENFNRVVENAAPQDVLHAAENLFMSKGGLYYFDLHYQQTVAARAMGLSEVANYIEDELKQILLRFPKLINYCYDNNMPFISLDNRAWLEQLLKPTTHNQVSTESDTNDISIADIVNSYRATVAGKSLREKIATFAVMPAHGERILCQQQLALARFCIEDKRVDLAVPILQRLADKVEQHQLQQWEPELAIFIWSQLSAVLKLRLPKLDKDMQKAVRAKLENLFNKICVTDLSRAL